MEELQRQFGDKIQIFLINTNESEEEINSGGARFLKARHAKDLKSASTLPSIVLEKTLSSLDEYYNSKWAKLWTFRGIPFHVIIDKNGIIRSLGGHEGTYPQKIQDIIDDKDVYSMNDINMSPNFGFGKSRRPYYEYLGNMTDIPVVYGAFFSAYNNNLGRFSLVSAKDSITKTTRKSYINYPLLNIFEHSSLGVQVLEQIERKHIVYNSGGLEQFIILPIAADTARITNNFSRLANSFVLSGSDLHAEVTSDDILKASCCYEQILPLSTSIKEQKDLMVKDLNGYLYSKLKLTAAIQTTTLPCYILTKRGEDKVSSKTPEDKSKNIEPAEVKVGKDVFIKYSNYGLRYLFHDIIGEYESGKRLSKIMYHNRMAEAKPFLIINETGWPDLKPLNMMIPKDLTSMDDLRKLLNQYNLELQVQDRSLDFIAFSPASN